MFVSPVEALGCWDVRSQLSIREVVGGGLINNTWSVGDPPVYALQRVNAIFPPAIHPRIAIVTAALAEAGISTPRLCPTKEGEWTVSGPDGTCWRLLTWVPGTSFHRLPSPVHAHDAGRLIGRFHTALLPLTGHLEPLRPGVHDTPLEMSRLTEALAQCDAHRLASGIEQTGLGILEAWGRCQSSSPVGLPVRPAHGDLKASNIRFQADGQGAVALIDLDTLGRFPLDVEMGDAFRSWCNGAGEDEIQAVFDPEIFSAGVTGYLSAAPFVEAIEREALVSGTWRISLELAARFCVDAFEERYFGWSPSVAPGRGEHNLIRAGGQLALASAIEAQRPELERLVVAAHRGHQS